MFSVYVTNLANILSMKNKVICPVSLKLVGGGLRVFKLQ